MMSDTSFPSWVRPEVDLVYCACAVGDRPRRIACFESIVAGRDIDWEYLIQVGDNSRITPMLDEAVQRCPNGAVPSEVREAIRRRAEGIKLGNLAMAHELVEIVRLLEEHGIAAMPLKGPVLAAQLYGDFTRRHCVDLDILIAKVDVPRANKLLLDRGYRFSEELTPEDEGRLLDEDCEFELESREKGIRIELHWDAIPRRHADNFSFELFEERREKASLAGVEFSVFTAEDLLIYLCVHGGDKHLWGRLRWLCDVAHLLESRSDLDWDVLMARAVEAGRVEGLLLGTYLAWLVLDAPLPAAIVDKAVGDPAVLARAGLVHGRLFQIPSRMPTYAEWRRDLETAGGIIRSRGFDDRSSVRFMRYLRAVLTPEWTDRQAREFPRGLSFLYYLYRPWRLLRKHRRRALRHVG